MSEFSIRSLAIHRFKSIRRLNHLPLEAINILIGANGAGKSNFVSFFAFMSELVNRRLQSYIAELGGAKRILSAGCHPSECFATIVGFECGSLIFIAAQTDDDRLQLVYEKFVPADQDAQAVLASLVEQYRHANGAPESRLRNMTAAEGLLSPEENAALAAIAQWRVYHFHDASSDAGVKRYCMLSDNGILHGDASNLAAVLYRLREKESDYYEFIRSTIMLVVPYFEDFVLVPREMPGSEEPHILLKWQQRGMSTPYLSNQFSDGTIRFICLATALLQPNPPETMLFDEPELGLHPSAVELLASMIRATSEKTQILVSTQSPSLLNRFVPENILVVEQTEGNSTFRRLDREEIGSWLDEYSLGQLWEKNILGGRPQ
ncbi:MAG: AAA family ATPase [Planctomycetaceae bacterium]|nr:AAA family ATPase [Planctomycetaceae bacterium]